MTHQERIAYIPDSWVRHVTWDDIPESIAQTQYSAPVIDWNVAARAAMEHAVGKNVPDVKEYIRLLTDEIRAENRWDDLVDALAEELHDHEVSSYEGERAGSLWMITDVIAQKQGYSFSAKINEALKALQDKRVPTLRDKNNQFVEETWYDVIDLAEELRGRDAGTVRRLSDESYWRGSSYTDQQIDALFYALQEGYRADEQEVYDVLHAAFVLKPDHITEGMREVFLRGLKGKTKAADMALRLVGLHSTQISQFERAIREYAVRTNASETAKAKYLKATFTIDYKTKPKKLVPRSDARIKWLTRQGWKLQDGAVRLSTNTVRVPTIDKSVFLLHASDGRMLIYTELQNNVYVTTDPDTIPHRSTHRTIDTIKDLEAAIAQATAEPENSKFLQKHFEVERRGIPAQVQLSFQSAPGWGTRVHHWANATEIDGFITKNFHLRVVSSHTTYEVAQVNTVKASARTAMALPDSWIRHMDWDNIPDELEQHVEDRAEIITRNQRNWEARVLDAVDSMGARYEGEVRYLNGGLHTDFQNFLLEHFTSPSEWKALAEALGEELHDEGLHKVQGVDYLPDAIRDFFSFAEEHHRGFLDLVQREMDGHKEQGRPTDRMKIRESEEGKWYELIDVAEALRAGDKSVLRRYVGLGSGWYHLDAQQVEALLWAMYDGFPASELDLYEMAEDPQLWVERHGGKNRLNPALHAIMARGLKDSSSRVADAALRATAANAEDAARSSQTPLLAYLALESKASDQAKFDYLIPHWTVTYETRPQKNTLTDDALIWFKRNGYKIEDGIVEVQGDLVNDMPWRRALVLFEKKGEGGFVYSRDSSQQNHYKVMRGHEEEHLTLQPPSTVNSRLDNLEQYASNVFEDAEKIYKEQKSLMPYEMKKKRATFELLGNPPRPSDHRYRTVRGIKKRGEHWGIKVVKADISYRFPRQNVRVSAAEKTASTMDQWIKHVTWDDIPDELEQHVRETAPQVHGMIPWAEELNDTFGPVDEIEWDDDVRERLVDLVATTFYEEGLTFDPAALRGGNATVPVIKYLVRGSRPGHNLLTEVTKQIQELKDRRAPTAQDQRASLIEETWYDVIDLAEKLRSGDTSALRLLGGRKKFDNVYTPYQVAALAYAILEGFNRPAIEMVEFAGAAIRSYTDLPHKVFKDLILFLAQKGDQRVADQLVGLWKDLGTMFIMAWGKTSANEVLLALVDSKASEEAKFMKLQGKITIKYLQHFKGPKEPPFLQRWMSIWQVLQIEKYKLVEGAVSIQQDRDGNLYPGMYAVLYRGPQGTRDLVFTGQARPSIVGVRSHPGKLYMGEDLGWYDVTGQPTELPALAFTTKGSYDPKDVKAVFDKVLSGRAGYSLSALSKGLTTFKSASLWNLKSPPDVIPTAADLKRRFQTEFHIRPKQTTITYSEKVSKRAEAREVLAESREVLAESREVLAESREFRQWLKHVSFDDIPDELDEIIKRRIPHKVNSWDIQDEMKDIIESAGPTPSREDWVEDILPRIGELLYENGLGGPQEMKKYMWVIDPDRLEEVGLPPETREHVIKKRIMELQREKAPTERDRRRQFEEEQWYDIIERAEDLRATKKSALHVPSDADLFQLTALFYAVAEGFKSPSEEVLDFLREAVTHLKKKHTQAEMLTPALHEILKVVFKKGNQQLAEAALDLLAEWESAGIGRHGFYMTRSHAQLVLNSKASERYLRAHFPNVTTVTYDTKVKDKKFPWHRYVETLQELHKEHFRLVEGKVVVGHNEEFAFLSLRRFWGLLKDNQNRYVVASVRDEPGQGRTVSLYTDRWQWGLETFSGQLKQYYLDKEWDNDQVKEIYKKQGDIPRQETIVVDSTKYHGGKPDKDALRDDDDWKKQLWDYYGVKVKKVETRYGNIKRASVEKTATRMRDWIKHVTWDDIPDELEQHVREQMEPTYFHPNLVHRALEDQIGDYVPEDVDWQKVAKVIAEVFHDTNREPNRQHFINGTTFYYFKHADEIGIPLARMVQDAYDELKAQNLPSADEQRAQLIEEVWYEIIDKAIALREGDKRLLHGFARYNPQAWNQYTEDQQAALLWAMLAGFGPNERDLYEMIDNLMQADTYKHGAPSNNDPLLHILLRGLKKGNTQAADAALDVFGHNTSRFSNVTQSRVVEWAKSSKASEEALLQNLACMYDVTYETKINLKKVDVSKALQERIFDELEDIGFRPMQGVGSIDDIDYDDELDYNKAVILLENPKTKRGVVYEQGVDDDTALNRDGWTLWVDGGDYAGAFALQHLNEIMEKAGADSAGAKKTYAQLSHKLQKTEDISLTASQWPQKEIQRDFDNLGIKVKKVTLRVTRHLYRDRKRTASVERTAASPQFEEWLKNVSMDNIPDELDLHSKKETDWAFRGHEPDLERVMFNELPETLGVPSYKEITDWEEAADVVAQLLHEKGIPFSALARRRHWSPLQEAAQEQGVDFMERVEDALNDPKLQQRPTERDRYRSAVEEQWYEVIEKAEELRRGDQATLRQIASLSSSSWESAYTMDQVKALMWAAYKGFGANESAVYETIQNILSSKLHQRVGWRNLEKHPVVAILRRGFKKGRAEGANEALRTVAAFGGSMRELWHFLKEDALNSKADEAVKHKYLTSDIIVTYNTKIHPKDTDKTFKTFGSASGEVIGDLYHVILQAGFKAVEGKGVARDSMWKDSLDYRKVAILFEDDEGKLLLLKGRHTESFNKTWYTVGRIEVHEPPVEEHPLRESIHDNFSAAFGHSFWAHRATIQKERPAEWKKRLDAVNKETISAYKAYIRNISRTDTFSLEANKIKSSGQVVDAWTGDGIREELKNLGLGRPTQMKRVYKDLFPKDIVAAVQPRTATSKALQDWIKHVTWDDIPDELEQHIQENVDPITLDEEGLMDALVEQYGLPADVTDWDGVAETFAEYLWAGEQGYDVESIRFNNWELGDYLKHARKQRVNLTSKIFKIFREFERKKRPRGLQEKAQFVEELWYDLIDRAEKLRAGNTSALRAEIDTNPEQYTKDQHHALLWAAMEGFGPNEPLLYDLLDNQMEIGGTFWLGEAPLEVLLRGLQKGNAKGAEATLRLLAKHSKTLRYSQNMVQNKLLDAALKSRASEETFLKYMKCVYKVTYDTKMNLKALTPKAPPSFNRSFFGTFDKLGFRPVEGRANGFIYTYNAVEFGDEATFNYIDLVALFEHKETGRLLILETNYEHISEESLRKAIYVGRYKVPWKGHLYLRDVIAAALEEDVTDKETAAHYKRLVQQSHLGRPEETSFDANGYDGNTNKVELVLSPQEVRARFKEHGLTVKKVEVKPTHFFVDDVLVATAHAE
jgi:hypothetical protein